MVMNKYYNKVRYSKKFEMYDFEFLLLCNKICGSNHFNMQMNIIVETEEEFNTWISEQGTIAETLKK